VWGKNGVEDLPAGDHLRKYGFVYFILLEEAFGEAFDSIAFQAIESIPIGVLSFTIEIDDILDALAETGQNLEGARAEKESFKVVDYLKGN
jgi:hypothetical protein